MNKKAKIMYSEIYNILNIMSEEYVKRIPNNLYELIKNNRLEGYNPTYNTNDSIVNQKMSKDTASMLVLLKLNYWCDNEEEKKRIEALLKDNSDKHKNIMREMYSSENMFKKINEEREKMKVKDETKDELIVIKEEKSFFKKFLNKIKELLKKK